MSMSRVSHVTRVVALLLLPLVLELNTRIWLQFIGAVDSFTLQLDRWKTRFQLYKHIDERANDHGTSFEFQYQSFSNFLTSHFVSKRARAKTIRFYKRTIHLISDLIFISVRRLYILTHAGKFQNASFYNFDDLITGGSCQFLFETALGSTIGEVNGIFQTSHGLREPEDNVYLQYRSRDRSGLKEERVKPARLVETKR